VLSALLGGWWVLALTAGNRWSDSAPDLSRAWQGHNAIANARVASAVLEQQNTDDNDARGAEALARDSLQRRPLNPVALRALALAAIRRGETIKAKQLLLLAERHSRRDTPTQILLIEFAVNDGDVSSALRHYDRALLVSTSSAKLLLPVLASASKDQEVRLQLGPILARRPEWLPLFIDELSRQNQIGLEVLVDLTNSIGLQPSSVSDVALSKKIISLMIRRNGYAEARALLGGKQQYGEQVRNGSFENPNLFPPFDWAFPSQSGWVASPSKILKDGVQLELRANYAAAGIAAQEMLALKHGPYVLRFRSGGDASAITDRPTVTISCAGGKKIPLVEGALLGDVRPKSQTKAFNVPFYKCSQQWIRVEGPAISGEQEHWIDNISVVPSSSVSGASIPR
jgi:Tfp pilus assembly protein PilF